MLAHSVHPVVPVAGSNQRKTEGAGQVEALVEPARAMLEERGRLLCLGRNEERVVCVGRHVWALKERQLGIENGHVA